MTQKPINPSLIARVTQAAQYVISGIAPDSWFGPNQPLAPMAPEDVTGRKFDYPVGYNLNYTPRSSEPLSFEDLRALADNCDIMRSVIETRKDQIEALGWTIRVKPSMLHSKKPTPEQQARIAYITEFLHSPDKENSFGGWLRQILEDMFVIDAVCIYKRRSLDGQLYALELIDGATIKILIDDSGRSPPPPEPAYQQVLKGVPAIDYTRDDLMYLKHNPRTHKVYGYSHVEQVMVTVNILIRRALHQLEYYREGSQPDAFIGLPKEWNQDQIVAFQRHFDAMFAGNSAMRRRLRFMPGEFKYQETKAPPLKDVYDEFLARIICFVFSISPEPFVSHVNRATAQSSQQRAQEEGLAPLQSYVCELLNRIIRVDFSSPDLEFIWQDNREQDPKDAASIDVAYVGAGIMTVDEVRAKLGLLPLGKQKAVEQAEENAGGVRKYNDNHDPDNGQFATSGGAGGEHQRTMDALSSSINKPSRLPQGTQVAGPEILAIPILEEMGVIGGTEATAATTAASTSAMAGGTVAEAATVTSTTADANFATIQDLLMPGGQRLEQAGSNGAIREVTGNLEDAQTLFDKLTAGGKVINHPTYEGEFMEIPSGGTVGIRTYSTLSPNTEATIDANIPGIKIDKIKFNP